MLDEHATFLLLKYEHHSTQHWTHDLSPPLSSEEEFDEVGGENTDEDDVMEFEKDWTFE